jgi:HlyD family secretion protein
MKKLIAAVVIAVLVVGGVVWVRGQRLAFSFLAAEFGVVKRGDLIVPIKASGKIQPKGRREIKGKASGEIIRVPFEVGKMVRQGDTLVELKPDDEQRSLDAAKASYEQAEITRDKARIQWEQSSEQTIRAAEAVRDRAAAQFSRVSVEYDFRKAQREKAPESISPQEWSVIEAQHKELAAALRSAEVDVDKAKTAKALAEREYKQTESALTTAQKKLEDAEERLRETLVRSPIDGMILKMYRHQGEMIQSGTQSLMGGTVLMDLADVSQVYMVASVDEADIGTVREIAPAEARPGADPRAASRPTTQAVLKAAEEAVPKDTRVTITVEAFPDEKFEGVIERISPEVEVMQAVATFEVRIRLTSTNREKVRNLVGMQAEAEFTSVPIRNALLVPYEAVKRGPGDDLGVYLPVKKAAEAEETPEFKKCKFGSDNGTSVVVLSGLEDGQRVYTKLPQKTEAEKKAEEKGS